MADVLPPASRAEVKRLIKAARERRGLSVEQVAAATRRKARTLREYERPNGSACPGYRLSLALSVVLDAPELVGALQRAALASLGLG